MNSNRIAGVWVKASERLPETKNEDLIWRTHDKTGLYKGFCPEHGFLINGHGFYTNLIDLIEWLDESQPIPVNQDDYWKKRCEAAENLIGKVIDYTYHVAPGATECLKAWQQLKSNPEPIPVQEGLREGRAIEILMALCRLKHHKDTVGKDSYYEKRQPELWKEANDFLNNRLSEPFQESDRDNSKEVKK